MATPVCAVGLHLTPNTLGQTLEQCFSTFFDSRHPFLAIEQFGGTPGYNLLINRRKVQKLAAPQELFTEPKGIAAPLLRTTALAGRVYVYLFTNYVFEEQKKFYLQVYHDPFYITFSCWCSLSFLLLFLDKPKQTCVYFSAAVVPGLGSVPLNLQVPLIMCWVA